MLEGVVLLFAISLEMFITLADMFGHISGDIFIAVFLFLITYRWPQRALYHNIQMTTTSWFYVAYFHTQQTWLYHLLMVSCVYSICHFFFDTLDVLFCQRKINWIVFHHIIGIYLLVAHLIYQQNLFLMAMLAFTLESSAMFYNLYYYGYIPKWFHLLFYLPLRTASNYLILSVVGTLKYENQTMFTLNLINYFLLFLFNAYCIYMGIWYFVQKALYCCCSTKKTKKCVTCRCEKNKEN
jgi:hypothetical protein